MDDAGRLRRCVRAVRTLPAVMCLVMTAHCALLLLGVSLPLAEYACGMSFLTCWLLMAFSRALRFCALHRALIIHTMLVSACISFERIIGFGAALRPARVVMLAVGAALLAAAVIRKSRCYGHGDV